MRQNIEVLDGRIRSGQEVAQLYAEVFAGPPWNEASRCPLCDGFSGTQPGECAPCQTQGCKGAYCEPAYPFEETAARIEAELAKPESESLRFVSMEAIRMVVEEILGFAWGYGSTGPELAGEKYRTEEMKNILLDLLIKAGGFFYISEVGVKPTLQGMGIGKSLTQSLAMRGKDKFETVVLRTNEASPMRYIAQGLGMKPIMGLDTGIVDQENEARVLFVGGKYDRE